MRKLVGELPSNPNREDETSFYAQGRDRTEALRSLAVALGSQSVRSEEELGGTQ